MNEVSKKKIVFLVSGHVGTFQVIQNACKYDFLEAYISCVIFDRDCKGVKRAQKEGVQFAIYDKKRLSDTRFQDLLYDRLKHEKPDIICLTFDSLLSKKIVADFKNRIINLHPALLPAFPGLKSVEASIARGVRYTGATIHIVDTLVDHGPIICQFVTPVDCHESAKNLAKKMFPYEALMMLQIVDWKIASRITINNERLTVKKASYDSYPFCPALDKFNYKKIKKIRQKLFENLQIADLIQY